MHRFSPLPTPTMRGSRDLPYNVFRLPSYFVFSSIPFLLFCFGSVSLRCVFVGACDFALWPSTPGGVADRYHTTLAVREIFRFQRTNKEKKLNLKMILP